MPIPINEARRHKGLNTTELKVVKFMEGSPDQAHTYNEIWVGIGWAGNMGLIKSLAVAYLLGTALDSLVKKKKVRVSEIGFQTYYYLAA